MTNTWLTLGLYAVGIIGGFFLGYSIRQTAVENQHEAFKKNIYDCWNKESRMYLQKISDLRNELAKLKPHRNEKGRFTKRQ